jgi:hypothetical protein
VPHRIVPGRNLAVLKKTTSDPPGKGSTQTKKVGVVLKARELTRGACRPGSSTDTFSLRLHMVDENGNEIDLQDDGIRTGLTCDRRIRQQKFMATYTVESCPESTERNSNSKGKSRNSKGKVTVTATTGDGAGGDHVLEVSRTLKCNK